MTSYKWDRQTERCRRQMQDAYIVSTNVASCERIWHTNIHSFRLITETLRAWWLAGSAFKCGYWGPQILTECQILRNYWCTQPATAPDTSQTESLNVTDKWIFMKLGERKEEQEERKNTEWEAGKETRKKITSITLTWKHVASSPKLNHNTLQRMWDQAFWMHCVTKALKHL